MKGIDVQSMEDNPSLELIRGQSLAQTGQGKERAQNENTNGVTPLL
jgi:hypothetical protein